uniref:G_PROTEIN_RECEP_F1_2 domain-containing protein n=1 Tax=Globodera pallida TaxID=36090 RepID=A0A183CIH0_GLOPA
MLRMPNSSVMCTASEVTQYEAAIVSYNATLILQCLSPIVYCVLAIFIYVKMPTNGQQQSNKSLFKSIIVLMLIQLFGWGSNSLSLLFFRQFFAITTLSDMTKWAMNCVFSYVLTVATTANAPTLYFCSFEYKTAFQAQFRSLFRSNKIAAVQQVKPIGGNNNNTSAGRTVQRVWLNA